MDLGVYIGNLNEKYVLSDNFFKFSNFRGVVPPLWGSGVYRSVQFSAFEAP